LASAARAFELPAHDNAELVRGLYRRFKGTPLDFFVRPMPAPQARGRSRDAVTPSGHHGRLVARECHDERRSAVWVIVRVDPAMCASMIVRAMVNPIHRALHQGPVDSPTLRVYAS
jgi:hypothetical protein